MKYAPAWLRKIVVIDVETTGLSAFHDRIVELGIAVFENGRWTHRADYFVNPEGRVLKQEVVDVHGITTEMVMDAPPFYEIYNKIAPFLYDAVPIAYNTSFDRRFLTHAVTRTWPRHAFHTLPPALQLDTRWIDVNPLARWCVPNLPGGKYKLPKVAEHLGFDTNEAHRADADALLAGAVLLRLIGMTPELDWSYQATLERAHRADTEYNAKKFFWQKPDKTDPESAWLGNGRAIQVYECDICHAAAPGIFKKKGWTEPEGWAYYGREGAQRLTCSPACDNVAMWHNGVLR
jgi:DNA polymerase III epsilon subunit family exonuclease